MDTIEQLEKRLWSAADQLRANSNLNSSEYMMPVLGILFLRHAYSRYLAVKSEIEPTPHPRRRAAPAHPGPLHPQSRALPTPDSPFRIPLVAKCGLEC